jgi:hypothetical protein
MSPLPVQAPLPCQDVLGDDEDEDSAVCEPPMGVLEKLHLHALPLGGVIGRIEEEKAHAPQWVDSRGEDGSVGKVCEGLLCLQTSLPVKLDPVGLSSPRDRRKGPPGAAARVEHVGAFAARDPFL